MLHQHSQTIFQNLPDFFLKVPVTKCHILRRAWKKFESSKFISDFFTSVAETVHLKIEFSSKSFRNFLSSEINDSFIVTSTNKEESSKIISSLNPHKSCGLNSIATKVLHLLQDQTSNHLATICNLSFSTGVSPAILKTAKVISVHKKEF